MQGGQKELKEDNTRFTASNPSVNQSVGAKQSGHYVQLDKQRDGDSDEAESGQAATLHGKRSQSTGRHSVTSSSGAASTPSSSYGTMVRTRVKRADSSTGLLDDSRESAVAVGSAAFLTESDRRVIWAVARTGIRERRQAKRAATYQRLFAPIAVMLALLVVIGEIFLLLQEEDHNYGAKMFFLLVSLSASFPGLQAVLSVNSARAEQKALLERVVGEYDSNTALERWSHYPELLTTQAETLRDQLRFVLDSKAVLTAAPKPFTGGRYASLAALGNKFYQSTLRWGLWGTALFSVLAVTFAMIAWAISGKIPSVHKELEGDGHPNHLLANGSTPTLSPTPTASPCPCALASEPSPGLPWFEIAFNVLTAFSLVIDFSLGRVFDHFGSHTRAMHQAIQDKAQLFSKNIHQLREIVNVAIEKKHFNKVLDEHGLSLAQKNKFTEYFIMGLGRYVASAKEPSKAELVEGIKECLSKTINNPDQRYRFDLSNLNDFVRDLVKAIRPGENAQLNYALCWQLAPLADGGLEYAPTSA